MVQHDVRTVRVVRLEPSDAAYRVVGRLIVLGRTAGKGIRIGVAVEAVVELSDGVRFVDDNADTGVPMRGNVPLHSLDERLAREARAQVAHDRPRPVDQGPPSRSGPHHVAGWVPGAEAAMIGVGHPIQSVLVQGLVRNLELGVRTAGQDGMGVHVTGGPHSLSLPRGADFEGAGCLHRARQSTDARAHRLRRTGTHADGAAHYDRRDAEECRGQCK